MKNLLIMRHAKSNWDDRSLEDHDRPLNARGIKDAPTMGHLLQAEGIVPDLIVSSTARRALDTAAAVAEGAGYAGEIIESPDLYAASASMIRGVVQGTDDTCERLLIVGHNPGIARFVSLLVGESTTMKTSAVVCVTIPVDQWADLDAQTNGDVVGSWGPKDVD